jgi:hypothetical protein
MLGTSSRVPLASVLATLSLLGAGAVAPAHANFESDFEGRMVVEFAGRYAKDHSIVQHTDGVYHAFYSRGNAGQGWNLPDSEIDVGHATSTDLIHWTILGPVLTIDVPHNWKARNIWAPHVIKVNMVIGGQNWVYLMAYTGVDSLRNQQIGIAVSNDLTTWTDLSVNTGAFRPNTAWAQWNPSLTWQNCRDPYVMKQGSQLILLTSVQTRIEYQNLGTRGAIALATSTDGLNWTDSGAPLITTDVGDASLLASSHMEQNPINNRWQLFYNRTNAATPGGVFTLSSASMTSGFVYANAVQFDVNAISSEIITLPSEVIYSRAVDYETQEGLATRAVRLDKLNWAAGGPSMTPINLFAAQWTQVAGNLGATPTFRDRPAFRGSPASNMQALFWINTAENHNGPLGGGCSTCGSIESQVGTLRSKAFTAHGLTMQLLVGGTASATAYVALVDSVSGAVLQEAHGLGTESMSARTWNIGSYLGDRLYLEIRDNDVNGHVSVDDIREVGDATSVPSAPPVNTLTALQVSPNPASGPMSFSYQLGERSGVVLAIYGPTGRLVREIGLGSQTAGPHDIAWDGRNRDGSQVPAGVYFVRMLLDGAQVSDLATRVTIVR